MKNFVVTGSTKGIGKAIVKAILDRYDDSFVFMSYHNDDNAAEICKKEFGNRVDVQKVDMGSYEEVAIYSKYLCKPSGGVDCLILNAGIGYKVPFNELNVEEWERVMRVNVSVPIFMIKELLQSFKKGSSIIMAGSLMGSIPHSGSLAYGVSKAAVHGAVKNLMKFLSPYEIRINAVAPGFTESEWHKGKPDDFFEKISTKIANHRWAKCEEIADAYLFAINNEYINGSIININGGYSYY